MDTIGKRIAYHRREKELTQEELAQKLGLSAQAVSKWENDQTCPDIQLLPTLCGILGITTDELLSGKPQPAVQMATTQTKKKLEDMVLRIVVDTDEGDKVRINLPMPLIKIAMEVGVQLPQITGNKALSSIDFAAIFDMAERGILGNLMEVESADGERVSIFVE